MLERKRKRAFAVLGGDDAVAGTLEPDGNERADVLIVVGDEYEWRVGVQRTGPPCRAEEATSAALLRKGALRQRAPGRALPESFATHPAAWQHVAHSDGIPTTGTDEATFRTRARRPELDVIVDRGAG